MHGFSYELNNKRQRGSEMSSEYILMERLLESSELSYCRAWEPYVESVAITLGVTSAGLMISVRLSG